ncbi:MAG TPA: hypothetical protein VGE77_10200 [Nocardioides sp.]
MSGLRVRRAPVADWYVEGDDSAVMVGANVLVLSALATAVLETLDAADGPDGQDAGAWTDATVVTAALVERFGAPDGVDVHEVTATALADLAAQHVVELDPPPSPGASEPSTG